MRSDPKRLMSDWDDALVSRPRPTRESVSQAQLKRIRSFCAEHKLAEIIREVAGKKILSLEKSDEYLDTSLLENLARAPIVTIQNRPFCNDTSVLAAQTNIASGVLMGERNRVIGFHVINYVKISDNSFISVDLTAFSHLDQQQGNYDILILRASSLEDLLQKVAEFYGGEWRVRV